MRIKNICLCCLLAFYVCGCDSNADVGDEPDGGESHSDVSNITESVDSTTGESIPQVSFQPFTVATRTLGHALDRFQLSLTDGTSIIACGLANDCKNSLGQAGHQIIMNLASFEGEVCPNGTHTVSTDCPDDPDSSSFPYYREGCAYYRVWDSDGSVIGIAKATAGAVEVSSEESKFPPLYYCHIQATFSFSGTSFSDSFNLIVSEEFPWCSQ